MRIAVAGASGRMGHMLIEAVLQNPELRLHSAIDVAGSPSIGHDAAEFLGKDSGVLIQSDLSVLQGAHCLIDFTRPQGTLEHLKACQQYGIRMVIGTTGFDQAGLDAIHTASQHIGIVFSPNMSIGVNTVYALLEKAAQLLDDQFDVEIFEAHHRNKVDAPSGTALKMGEVIATAKGRSLSEVADWARHGHTGVRQKGHIGYSVLRGGDIIGDHCVSFCGIGERIEINHKASNRVIYAQGSLKAALFLHNHPVGLFSMRDVVNASLNHSF